MPEPPLSVPLPPGFVLPEVPDPPATPRDAATVMLIRDAAAGVEVFLQRRVAGMAFAGGMTVFPGGGVDPRDADAAIAWAGPDVGQWARWFDCADGLARELVCAAVRETFEECGVLLAGPSAEQVVVDTAPYAAARDDLGSRKISLADFLADAGLVLRADLLRPWASWVTPPQERRRYDARFFLAALPDGQRADDATTETESSGWYHPKDALAEADAGHIMMMPPTRFTVAELAECDSADSAMRAERSVPRFEPRITSDSTGARVVFR